MVFYKLVTKNLSTTLKSAGKDFSATTQIRFGQEDNYQANSTTGSDGITIDDITIYQRFDDDAGILSVDTPSVPSLYTK